MLFKVKMYKETRIFMATVIGRCHDWCWTRSGAGNKLDTAAGVFAKSTGYPLGVAGVWLD